jgi:TPR repeat protein
MHLKGLYVKQNLTTAKQYFEMSAEKGMAAGYNGVGVMHVRDPCSRALAAAPAVLAPLGLGRGAAAVNGQAPMMVVLAAAPAEIAPLPARCSTMGRAPSAT